MSSDPIDVGQIRLDNALRLFDEFIGATGKHPDAATLRVLERRFAERLDVQSSYWSQIRTRSRQIGERLARQFEQRCHKPRGWMDLVHDTSEAGACVSAPGGPSPAGAAAAADSPSDSRFETTPQDDAERFIVGLVLTYYRRHPQRARTRLLDLLGEVLEAPAATRSPPAPRAAAPGADADDLWTRTQAGVAPLKRKR